MVGTPQIPMDGFNPAPTVNNGEGPGSGKGGKGALCANDERAAEGRIGNTRPGIFSADETADFGVDLGAAAFGAFPCENDSTFNGKVARLTVDVSPSNA